MRSRSVPKNRSCLTALCLLLLSLCLALPAWAQDPKPAKGRLYLVGLGAGDLDNMTIRAQKVLARAAVVFAHKYALKHYADILKGKELHDAGLTLYMKNVPRRRMSEAEVKALEDKNRRIIRQAVAAGKTVAVISGGDALLYGPHAAYLTEFQDLKPEVVPGLSCFNAANAALQRGVVNGRVSRSVILTAARHANEGYPGKDTPAKMAETQSTMVLFTMHIQLPRVIAQLKQGYPGDTPMAVVCHAGYRDKEKVILATVDTMLDRLKGQELPFENLIYVGDFLR